jgi:hypothetical protein
MHRGVLARVAARGLHAGLQRLLMSKKRLVLRLLSQ